MDLERHKPTYEEIGEIARQSALWSHWCGCALILAVLLAEKYDLGIITIVAVEMVVFWVIPLIIAAVVTEVVAFFFIESTLPIPLFVRSCTVTLELVLVSWILIVIDKPYRAMEL